MSTKRSKVRKKWMSTVEVILGELRAVQEGITSPSPHQKERAIQEVETDPQCPVSF
jgi:hypothetical protein